MVKTRGPMLSLSASGTLADAMTFSSWKGRSYVRQRAIPANPQTGPQVGRRQMLRFLTRAWQYLSAADQATWQTVADQLVASRFNAYLSVNMENWHNFLAPSHSHPPARDDAAGTETGIMVANWQENRIAIANQLLNLNQNWGFIIYASLVDGFSTSVATTILLEPLPDLLPRIWYWTPPSIGTWYFNGRPFSLHGVLGTEVGQGAAVP